MGEYRGSATLEDGTRVALTEAEAKALWDASTKAKEDAARDMPTTEEALRAMQSGHSRLRDLGWKEGMYCPKDGTPFAVIQYGSTGIFEGWYMGEWPTGHVYCCDYLDHPHGLLWKALDALTDAERAKMDMCMGREKAAHDRMIQSMVGDTPND